MEIKQPAPPMPTTVFAGSLATTLIGLLWFVGLMLQAPAMPFLARICGHDPRAIGHCPSCYVALTMIVGGLLIAAAGAGPVSRTAEARPGPRRGRRMRPPRT